MLAGSDLNWVEESATTFSLTPEGGQTVFVHQWEDFLRVFARLGPLPGENPYLQGCAALGALRFNYEDPVGRISLADFEDEGYVLFWEAQVPMSVATVQYLSALSQVGSVQVERWGQFMATEEMTAVSGLYPGGDEAALTDRLEAHIKAAELTYEVPEREEGQTKIFKLPYDNEVDVFVSIWNGMAYTRAYTGGMPGDNTTQQGQYAIEMLARNWDDPFGRLALDTDNDLVWESQVPIDFITPDYIAILTATCATQVADFLEVYGEWPFNG